MTPDTRTALETLLKECRTVLGFAQSWQPLTPGDLSDLRRAVDAASALLSTSPGEPEDETCETCGMPITGPTVRTRDDVPLCEACADDFAREKPVGPHPVATFQLVLMPQIQLGDVVTNIHGKRARIEHPNVVYTDDQMLMSLLAKIERNGVVIWTHQENPS